MVRVNIAFTGKFFKEYYILYKLSIIIFRLIDFALVVFKVCGIIRIIVEFFTWKEQNMFFKIFLNRTLVSFIGNKMYNNQSLTHNELIVVREHRQKTFVTLSGFWPLSGWEVSVSPLKKENSWRKYFFQIMLDKALKTSEKWYLLM